MKSNYVLVTPAYNEELYIEKTIRSVINQSILPSKWVIVNDGSTDNTFKIVRKYLKEFKWIECITKKKKNTTYYSSNVVALIKGIKLLEAIEYDFLCILDADIELCDDYYEKVFNKFRKNNKLGIATGTYLEKEGKRLIEAKIDRKSTPKAIQVIRRDCYSCTGGYIPFLFGGEDAGLEIMARLRGWETWSFREIKVLHNRPVGTGDGSSIIYARFRLGITDYTLGAHPIFVLAKCIKRCFWERPYIISGMARLIGFIAGYLKRLEIQLPDEGVRYLRKEQLRRLIHLN